MPKEIIDIVDPDSGIRVIVTPTGHFNFYFNDVRIDMNSDYALSARGMKMLGEALCQ